MVKHSPKQFPTKPPVSAGRKRQSAQTVSDAILSAAESVVALNGRYNFTLREVAHLAKISPSSIYDHFRNKGALVAAVRLRLMR